jgi:predicted metal-dependent hydrolase
MSHKSAKIAERVAAFAGGAWDARYLGYFDCFNRGEFYEAHDVLEDLWLLDRHGADGNFYKGLIQLAGAFVHVQKRRWQPAGALLRLARKNLEAYPGVHQALDLKRVLEMAAEWEALLSPVPAGANAALKPYPRLPTPQP